MFHNVSNYFGELRHVKHLHRNSLSQIEFTAETNVQ